MKIGFNGRFLSKPYTGIGKHTFGLLKALAVAMPKDRILVAVDKWPVKEILSELEKFKNVEVLQLAEFSFLARINAGLSKTVWERRQLSALFRHRKVDLVHIPYPSAYSDSFCPFTVTVHDVIPWVLPEYKARGFLSGIYNKLAKKSSLKAVHLFTVSDFSKSEIVKAWKVKAAKITVIQNGVELGELPDEHDMKRILEKYAVDASKPFVFYLGGFDERKGVSKLVDIFTKCVLPSVELNLVIGGEALYSDKLYRSYGDVLKAARKWPGNVILAGRIEERDLAAFYRACSAYVNFSSYEGFNLPLAEALVVGAKCVVEDIPVNREISRGANAVTYVDLGENDLEIAKVVIQAVRAKKHSKSEVVFDWGKSAGIVRDEFVKIGKNMI